jgi:hypothetical protein
MGNANSSDDNGQQQQQRHHLPNPANHPHHHHLAAAAAVRNFLKNAVSGVANASGSGNGNNVIGVSKAELDERCRPSGYVLLCVYVCV